MVAIFTGAGAGFDRGSGSVLGSAGLLGSSSLGRGNEQVFLNAATGNLMISHQDEFVVGFGSDLPVTRTYNSLGDLSDENADNWRYSTDRRVYGLTGTLNTAGSTVKRVSADGSEITYTWDASQGLYVGTDGAGSFDTLYQGNNTWYWTDGDTRSTEQYTAYGSYWRIANQCTADGQGLTFTYNGTTGKLDRITTNDGSFVQYDWTGNNITDVLTGYTDLRTNTAKTLTRARYAYDGQNRLSTVTVDLTPDDSSIADGKVYTTTYSYDGASTRVASISQSDGSRIDVTYDQTTFKVTSITQMVSTGVARTTSVAYGAGCTTITDPLGQIVRLDYDANDNLTQITMPPANGGTAPQVTQFAYDASGDVTSVTRGTVGGANGPELVSNGTFDNATGWSTAGHVAFSGGTANINSATSNIELSQAVSLPPAGTQFQVTFTISNHVSGAIGFKAFGGGGNIDGQPHSSNGTFAEIFTVPAGGASTIANSGFLSYGAGFVGSIDNFSIRQLGGVTPQDQTTYSNFVNGLATTITDPLGNVTTRTYGSRNELLTETTAGSDASSAAASHTVRYAYDSLNHLRYRISAEGHVTEYRYQRDLVVNTIEYPEQVYTGTDLSTLPSGQWENAITTWVNAIPDKSSTKYTEYYYDARGNLATSYSYSIANTDGTYSNADGSTVTLYTYDQAGRLKFRNVQNQNVETFVYDGMGRLTSAVDVNGGTTSYVFDDANTKTIVTLASGLVQTSTYNKAGELIVYNETTEPNYITNSLMLDDTSGWTLYNATRVAGTNGLPYVVQQTSSASTAEVDTAGGIRPLPAGSSFNLSYMAKPGASGQQFSVGIYWYDANGAFITSTVFNDFPTDTSRFTTYQHQVTKPANAVSYSMYMLATSGAVGQLGNLQLTAAPTAASNVAATDFYKYDADGRLRVSTDATGNSTYYLYDNAGRKTAEVSAAGEITEYRYDADDRIIATVSYATVLTAAQLTTLGSASAPADVANFRPASSSGDRWSWRIYDKDGRVLQTIDGDGSTTINTYDAEGKLVQSVDYADTFGPSPLNGFKTNPPTSVVTSWTTYTPPPPAPTQSANLRPTLSNAGQWLRPADMTQTSTTQIAGQSAWIYSEPAQQIGHYDPLPKIWSAVNVDAGQTLTWTITLKGVAGAPASHLLGMVLPNGGVRYSRDHDTNVGSATITGGPGTLTLDSSGLWSISGLSTTQATTLTISHTFTDADTVNLDVFFQPTSSSADSIILSNPIVTTTSGEVDPIFLPPSSNLLPDLANSAQWTETNASQTAAAPVNNQLAWSYSPTANRVVSTIDGHISVAAGDTLSWTMTVLPGTGTDVGFAMSLGGQGGVGVTTTNVGGLATLTQDGLGYWVLSGASRTDPTVVRITHTFTQAATVDLQVAIDPDSNVSSAHSVILSNPVVTKTPASALTGYTTLHQLTPSSSDAVTRYFYDKDGRSVGKLDAEGNVTQCVYDKAGQKVEEIAYANAATNLTGTFAQVVASVTPDSANDRHTHYVYNGQGQLRFVVDGENYVSETKFDNAQATSVIRYANKIASSTTDFTYDNVKALVGATSFPSATDDRTTWSVYDSAGRVAFAIDGEGGVTAFTYNSAGQVIKTTQFAKARATTSLPSKATMDSWASTNGNAANDSIVRNYYDASGVLRYVVDGEGYVTRQTVDAEGRLTSVDRYANALSFTDADTIITVQATVASSGGAATTTSTAYDVDGRVAKTTDAAGGQTSFVYNAFGNVVQTTDALGNVTYNYYDALGRVTMSCDALNYITQTSYTPFGEVASVTRRYIASSTTPTILAPPTITTSPNDAKTSFTYDRLGRLTQTTDAQGNYEKYTLDAFGSRAKVRNKLGGIINNTFDRRGLLTLEDLPMSSYDKDGNLLALRVKNSFTYDARGNRKTMIEADGLPEHRTTTYDYDRNNRLVDKKGDNVNTISFDLTQTSFSISSGNTTPTEKYFYDTRGNLIQVTDANLGKTYSWYDQAGRKTDQLDPLGYLTHWDYDAQGNVKSERRYATKWTGVVDPTAAPPAVAPGAADRITSYSYDALNRLHRTSVDSAYVGTWNAATSALSVATTTTTLNSYLDYDANGNVIKATDANGGIVYSWYDKLGRKTDQVDQEGYLTHWDYDGEGNVLSERRYWTKVSGTPDPAVLPNVASTSNDRITNFTYDLTGHRLSETRVNVLAWDVSATNGALTVHSAASMVKYSYNALGQVLTKTEATGEKVTYTYDNTGRLITESRDTYTDQNGLSVTPTVNYYYNGLNNLARTQQGDATLNAADRVTKYTYGAGGRLASMTDAANATHNYDYDTAGHVVRDSYTRAKSSGSVTDATFYSRDALGRVNAQTVATLNTADGSWTRGDYQNTQYDGFGEVAQRGVNGMSQETFVYNNRGLVEKSNTGDGVWRLHVYDANGNEVLTIESEGKDYSATTLALALNDVGTSGTSYTQGVNATITGYDKRNQVTQVRLPQRETTAQETSLTTLVTSQTYNAFGEVATQLDPLGNVQATQALKDARTTYFAYNTMGRLVQKTMPQVSITSEAGQPSTVSPTETYYYDISGRQVGKQDANGNTISQTLLDGSGYGGTDAQTLKEFHPDNGIKQTQYDVFGDARVLTDELNRSETRSYDGMGRLLTVTHRTDSSTYSTALVDHYTYDILGQRITHWNSALGSTVVESTDYDRQGRVEGSKDLAGDTTKYDYAWDPLIGTQLGATGGWKKTTTLWAGKSYAMQKWEKADVYGLTTAESDLGGNATSYTYDKAGRLTNKSGTAGGITTTLDYTYFNTGLVSQITDTGGANFNTITSTFAYDLDGRRTKEKYAGTIYKSTSDVAYTSLTSSTQTLEDATIGYDALGRLTSYNSTGTKGTVSVTQKYDAAGNIRETNTTYPNLINNTTATTDKWFRYDSMNRMVVADGTLSGGAITGGTALSYDAAGNRKTATKGSVLETYYYDGNNQVWKVTDGTFVVAQTTRDLLGRVTEYKEYSPNSPRTDKIATHRYSITYNARNQVTHDYTDYWINGGTDYIAEVTNQYDNGQDGPGNLTRMDSVNDNGVKDTWQSWSYVWRDQAVVDSSTFDRATWDANANYYSWQYYDGLGRLQRAKIADGKPRDVHFALTSDGQVLSRVQNDGTYSSGGGTSNDPQEYFGYVNGVQIADYTDDNASETQNYDYQSLINSDALPGTGSGRLYQGSSTGAAGAETGTSGYDPINAITAGAGKNGRSAYVVQSGDTLAGIAQQVWGDASLWYLIADANGLSADSMLTAGQALSLPLKGPSNSSNASMFRPYDSAGAIGDLSPTSVKPPKKGRCGAFGQILLVAIAVAVTAVTAGAAAAAIGPASGILGGLGSFTSGALGFGASVAVGAGSAAIGSIVSQGVGVATGIQPSFSWKGVALAALAGGLSGGISAVPGLQGGGIFGAAARGAGSSALTQSIGVVTGLQDKFDWAGVAAAGVAAGASFGIARGLKIPSLLDDHSLSNQLANSAVSMAGAIANAATRSVINGSDFGDNIIAALPDTLGQTIGDLFTYSVAGRATSAAKAGTGDGVDDDPTTGEGGGQVGGDESSNGSTEDDFYPAFPTLAAGAAVSPVLMQALVAGAPPSAETEAAQLLADSDEVVADGQVYYANAATPAVPIPPEHPGDSQLLADGTIVVTAQRPAGAAGPIRALLERISLGEGTSDAAARNHGFASGYDITLGYGQFAKSSIPLSQMTLAQVDKLQSRILDATRLAWGSDKASSAVGKYEITRTTLRKLRVDLGLSDDMILTPALQDRLGIKLLEWRGLKAYQAGKISAAQFQLNLAKEWASIASPYTGKTLTGQHLGTTSAQIQAVIARIPRYR
jgi:YD repeat-containing protein